MNTRLIKHATLAAAILAGGGVAYGAESALHVVYCKATITSNNGERIVSVTLPPTEGYYDMDGNPLTYWNVGNVPAGGVADSWHQEGGPGRFTAHNDGNVGAYFYLTTSSWGYASVSTNVWRTVDPDVFGWRSILEFPAISPQEYRRWDVGMAYHLAWSTDTMAKVPTWHSLDHRYEEGGLWSTEEQIEPLQDEVAGYMGYVDAGDYLTFDLKFWAPPRMSEEYPVLFTFCVEASSFPLWDHDRAVE